MKKIDYFIVINFVFLVLFLNFFNESNVDINLQNLLFNFENKTWLIDSNEPIKKFIFYKLPKILYGILVIFLLFLAIFHKKDRARNILLILALLITPLIAGNIKKFTNIYCPNKLEIYGGDKPYVKILEKYPQDFVQTKKPECFPAGHSVTGFALIAFFLIVDFSVKNFSLAFFSGWILGFYQMAKGVHFLSDTVISMFVTFLISALIVRVFSFILKKKSPQEP